MTNLMELLPQSLRTPCRSPSREAPKSGKTYGKELHPDQLAAALGGAKAELDATPTTPGGQRITVRKVRRTNSSSPESDDTYPGEEDDISLTRDDRYLVSDRTENKFYGTVHAGAGGSGCASAHQYSGTPIIGPPLGYLQSKLQSAQYLCPGLFPWVDRGPATEESGRYVMKLVGILYLLILVFDLIIVCALGKSFFFNFFFSMNFNTRIF